MPPVPVVEQSTVAPERYRDSPPATSHTLRLSLGSWRFALHLEEATAHRARHRYAPFVVPGGGAFPIFVRRDPIEENPAAAFRYGWQDAWLDLEPTRAIFSGVAHEQTLDSLLRILLSRLALAGSGLLLHAASIIRHSHAFVFMGRSGAGKSTLARLAPTGSVLTDELSLVRLGASGLEAYGTPFWGEFRAAGQNRRLPVGGLYALAQASETRVEELSRRRQLTTLLANTLYFATDPASRTQLLALALRILEHLPIRQLHFRPEANVWKVIGP